MNMLTRSAVDYLYLKLFMLKLKCVKKSAVPVLVQIYLCILTLFLNTIRYFFIDSLTINIVFRYECTKVHNSKFSPPPI